MAEENNICPKCGSPLGEIIETAGGKRLRHCSQGSWNPQTKKNEGCDYVMWLPVEPKELPEKCPKCGAPLLLVVTRFGKKMKKCSHGGWDKATRQATGCDYVEWINGTTEPLDEECPECGKPLVLYTTNAGKRMKKCSAAGWDREAHKPTGCTYVHWLKPGDVVNSAPDGTEDGGGEEYLPPEN